MKPGYAEMTAGEASQHYRNAAEAAEENYNQWENRTVKGIAEDTVHYGFMWRHKRKRGLNEAKQIFEEYWKMERAALKRDHKSFYYRAKVYGDLDPTTKVSIPFPIGAK
jgi:hypothetical protein